MPAVLSSLGSGAEQSVGPVRQERRQTRTVKYAATHTATHAATRATQHAPSCYVWRDLIALRLLCLPTPRWLFPPHAGSRMDRRRRSSGEHDPHRPAIVSRRAPPRLSPFPSHRLYDALRPASHPHVVKFAVGQGLSRAARVYNISQGFLTRFLTDSVVGSVRLDLSLTASTMPPGTSVRLQTAMRRRCTQLV